MSEIVVLTTDRDPDSRPVRHIAAVEVNTPGAVTLCLGEDDLEVHDAQLDVHWLTPEEARSVAALLSEAADVAEAQTSAWLGETDR